MSVMRVVLFFACFGMAKAGTCSGTKDQFTAAEAKEMVDLTNKLRCVVGSPKIEWDHALGCQAQEIQDKMGEGLHHSQSYSLPIKAGENLAGGHDVKTAVYGWFTEYLQQGSGEARYQLMETGHYTTMVWKGNTKMGCGILRTSSEGWQGLIRCQFAGDPLPNMDGMYDAQVPDFHGEASKLSKCGVDLSELKSFAKKFEGYGILHPKASYSASLGLFSIEDKIFSNITPVSMVLVGAAGAAVVVAGALLGLRRVRRNQVANKVGVEDAELLSELSDTLE
jgi:hypothetical protein